MGPIGLRAAGKRTNTSEDTQANKAAAADGVPRLGAALVDGRNCKADLADIPIARSAQASGCEAGITVDKGAAMLPFFSLLT